MKTMLISVLALSGLAFAEPAPSNSAQVSQTVLQAKAADCCQPKSDCCKPGADCCQEKKTDAKAADCCAPGAACCVPQADCCK